VNREETLESYESHSLVVVAVTTMDVSLACSTVNVFVVEMRLEDVSNWRGA
jgi:hypothetical protein